MNDIEIKKVTISGTGAVTAQVLDAMDKITMADIAALITIIYTTWLLATNVYDRFKKGKDK